MLTGRRPRAACTRGCAPPGECPRAGRESRVEFTRGPGLYRRDQRLELGTCRSNDSRRWRNCQLAAVHAFSTDAAEIVPTHRGADAKSKPSRQAGASHSRRYVHGPRPVRGICRTRATVIGSTDPLLSAGAPAVVITEAGHIDVLIANLAIPAPTTVATAATEEEWNDTFAALVHPLVTIVPGSSCPP